MEAQNVKSRRFEVTYKDGASSVIEAGCAGEAWVKFAEANGITFSNRLDSLPAGPGRREILLDGKHAALIDELYVPPESDATGLVGFASELATGTRDAIQIDGELIGSLFTISPVVRVYNPEVAA